MAMAPVREFEVVFAAMEYVIVPLLLPLLPDVIFTQDAPLLAFQSQPYGAVMLMLPVSVSALWDRLVGKIE